MCLSVFVCVHARVCLGVMVLSVWVDAVDAQGCYHTQNVLTLQLKTEVH